MVTNQDVINIFYGAADVLGIPGGWALVEKAGWEWLSSDRNAAFDVSHMEDKPEGLSEMEWAHLHSRLYDAVSVATGAPDATLGTGHAHPEAEDVTAGRLDPEDEHVETLIEGTTLRVRQSKIGYGILYGFDPQFVKAITDIEPRGVLLLDDQALDFIETVIDTTSFPSVRWIWKNVFEAGDRATDWLPYVESRLQGRLDEFAAHAANQGKRLYFQSFNEPTEYANLPLMRAYGEFEAERARITWDRCGAVSLVGNFAMGTTSSELMDAFLVPELLEQAKLGHAYLALHEYFYALPWCWMGPYQGGDIVPDDRSKLPPLVEPGGAAWLVGRFQHIGVPAWMPIVLTEFGADMLGQHQVQQQGLPARGDGEPFGGYRTVMPWWSRTFPDLARNPARFYGYDLLGWCDRYLQQFPQIVWAAIFSGTGPHYEDSFADFDLAWTDALPASLQWVKDQGWTETSVSTEPPE
jgi:hypothetical protein